MKHLFMATAVCLVLSFGALPLQAAEETPTPAEPAATAELLPEAAASCEAQAVPFGNALELENENQAPVCSCRDLCKSDRQCERLFGSGSVCLPVGSCGCRECFATS